ncbi:MAG: S9 family peptidase [Bacteroidota bacterium]
MKKIFFPLLLLLSVSLFGQPTEIQKFEPLDVFQLENISDPQISPDGKHVIYARVFRDIMTDRTLSNLWIVQFDGENHHPLTTGNHRDTAPRWSPDGKQLLYRSNRDGAAQIYLRWLDSGAEAKLTNLTEAPGTPVWSPDGKWMAFTMFVPEEGKSFAKLPKKPEGARWADAAKYIDKMQYRRDGGGYVETGHRQLFVLSTDGGTPRQITSGPYNAGTPEWSKDGQSLLFSANRHENNELDPRNSEIYEVLLKDLTIKVLTSRQGPDNGPMVSPDGQLIAYLGGDDNYHGYQLTRLYVMNRDGSNPRLVSKDFDRDFNNHFWSEDNRGLYFQYDDKGETKIAHMTLAGEITHLTQDVGGLSIGRPYAGGDFSVSNNGRYAFTHGTADHLADLGVGQVGSASRRLTHLNDDLFAHKELGEVEEFWTKSSYDGRDIQSWIVKPPGFDPAKKYPLILEIHGGPFTNYGDRFSAEVQLYAAAGYVVVYSNPRGSTSYGLEFGDLIHHNYPSQDYDDLMSAVDAAIAKGYVDENRLYVTGGSGGGVLTAWIVGHTDRFKAAVVAKPVINWYSFVLNADGPAFFYKYWFPGLPWDHLDHYMKRSPLSYAKNVKTPTMLLTGEVDYRTPISETEQYYTALKLMGVETAMVRFPQAGHGIASRPSYLMSKALHVLEWFGRYP